jgi:hypothetical protein
MTDANAGEMPAEQVLPIPPPAPEAPAELDAAPGHAADGLAPEADQDDRSALVDAVAAPSADATAERPLPFDVEHLGVLRRSVLDALADADEPLSVARIIQELPSGTTRNSAETAIRREHDAGRIERVAPGTYRIAPAKPPGAKPGAPPEPDKSEDEWVAAIELWVIDPESWSREALGPRPDEPGRRIPADIVAKGVDRSRKRKERRKEAEAAAAKRTAADAELRDRLIAATGGNVIRGPGIDDVAPIKLALELVPLDRVVSAIRSKTDKKMFPGNEPATSWREERLLREIAECYFWSIIQPRLVAAWAAAGRPPAPTAEESSPPDAPMADIDELRSQHDSPSAPAGPHVMQPDVALDMPHEAASASEAPAAVPGTPRAGKRIHDATAAARRQS